MGYARKKNGKRIRTRSAEIAKGAHRGHGNSNTIADKVARDVARINEINGATDPIKKKTSKFKDKKRNDEKGENCLSEESKDKRPAVILKKKRILKDVGFES